MCIRDSINAIMGKKIAITSDTAQTTRHRFRAVLTREDFQLILVDTPGLHKPCLLYTSRCV